MADTSTIDAAKPSGIQASGGRPGGGSARKPKLIVLGKTFSGGAFVSYVFVNGIPAHENSTAQIKPGDQIAVAGGGLVNFLSWIFFQVGKPGKPIANLVSHSDSRVVFQVPDWKNIFAPGLPTMLTFTDKNQTGVWGLPVSFSFGEDSEQQQQQTGSQKIGDQLNRRFAEGQKTGSGGLAGAAMEATEAAVSGVLSPFLPNADVRAAKDALDAAIVSGDRKKIEQAINNIKGLGKDKNGSAILREAANKAPRYASLFNNAISEIDRQNISKAEVEVNLNKIADSASIDDIDESEGNFTQETQTGSGGVSGTVESQIVGEATGGGAQVQSEVSGSSSGSVAASASDGGQVTADVSGNQQTQAASATNVSGQAALSGGATAVPAAGGEVSGKIIAEQSISASATQQTATEVLAQAVVGEAAGGLSGTPTAAPAQKPETVGVSASVLTPADKISAAQQNQLNVSAIAEVSGQGGTKIDAKVKSAGAPQTPPPGLPPKIPATPPAKAQGTIDGATRAPKPLQQEVISGKAAGEQKSPGQTGQANVEISEQLTAPAGFETLARNDDIFKKLNLGPEAGEKRRSPDESENKTPEKPGLADKDEHSNDSQRPQSRRPEQHEPGEPAQELGEPNPVRPAPESEPESDEGPAKESPEEPGAEHLPKFGQDAKIPEPPAGEADVSKGTGTSAETGETAAAAETSEVAAGAGALEGAEAGAAVGGPAGAAAGALLASQAGKGGKDSLIKEAVDLVNPAMNDFLIQGAIWVWATAIPSIGLSVLLGAIIGDLLSFFKKRLIKSALDKVWLAKTIVGDEVDADEIADEIQFSMGVKANVAVMNLVASLLIVIVIVLTGAAAYLGCTYPLGQTIAAVTNYQATILGGVGLSGVCNALSAVNTSINGPASISNSVPAGSCSPAVSGIAAPGQLALTCFGSGPTIDNTASIVAMHESTGNAAIPSSVDKCQPGGQPVSFGLFQINITNHQINGLNCPAAFGYPPGTSPQEYDANNHQCTIVDQTLYNNCVTAAETAQYNIQAACQISSNGTNWSAWQADINACGISKTISPGT